MLVCSAFCKELPSEVKELTISDSNFGQQQLAYLARTFTNVEHLDISQEYSDHTPVLAFHKVQLPALKHLSLSCKPIERCSFTQHNTPQLEVIDMTNAGSFFDFDLDLPCLTTISMEHTQADDPSNFGPSLNKCPKLQRFSSYKLWGLSGVIHKLHLPECTSLDLSRSDDLEGLELWAPKLSMLGLRACYSIDQLRIMDDPPGTTPTPLTVNLINANIDRVSRQLLKQHPRVKAGAVWTRESQEWGGLAAELGLVEGEDDDAEEDEDELFGDYDDDDMDVAAMMGAFAGTHGIAGGGGALHEQVMAGLMMQLIGGGGMPPEPVMMFNVNPANPDGLHMVYDAGQDDDQDEDDEDGSSWETADEAAAAADEEGQEGDDTAVARDDAGISQPPGASAGASSQMPGTPSLGRKTRPARGGLSCVIEEVE